MRLAAYAFPLRNRLAGHPPFWLLCADMTAKMDRPEKADSDKKQQLDPETWVAAYGDYLYRYALLRLRDHATAQDVVQEALMAGVKGLDRFDGRVDVKYWLRGILKNKIVDHIRKSSRMQPVEDIGDYELPDSIKMKWFGIPTSRPEPWAFDIHQAFDQKEFWAIFEKCVQGIPGVSQKAFVLKEIEGQSTEDICKLLDVTPNNVWVMVHRARGALKNCLESNWGQLTG